MSLATVMSIFMKAGHKTHANQAAVAAIGIGAMGLLLRGAVAIADDIRNWKQ